MAAVLGLVAAILVLLAALVQLRSVQIRRQSAAAPTNAHDREVFDRLTSLLPEVAFQSFLDRVVSARRVEIDFAARLEDWVTTASFANNEFLDAKLERRKRCLAKAIWELLAATHPFFSAAPAHSQVAVMKPDMAGIEGPTPWDYPEIAKKLRKFGAATLQEYYRFIKEGHARLHN